MTDVTDDLNPVTSQRGGCFRCAAPHWRPNGDRSGVRFHSTPYAGGSRGLFPLCETCWSGLKTPEARWPFYLKLLCVWLAQTPTTEFEREWFHVLVPDIRRAVMEET